jgi:SOS response regulatory protein OraA/RecX
MPIKLGKSHTTVDRATKKATTVHPYIKGFAKKELIEKYNASNTRPKDKQKIKNELVRRGGVVFS